MSAAKAFHHAVRPRSRIRRAEGSSRGTRAEGSSRGTRAEGSSRGGTSRYRHPVGRRRYGGARRTPRDHRWLTRRGHATPHHRVVQSLGPDELEAGALVDGLRAVVEERRGQTPLSRDVGVALDEAAAGLCDQRERTLQGDSHQTVLAEPLVDENAGDPVVGFEVLLLKVLLAVVDVGQLCGGSILGPGDRLLAVLAVAYDERSMGDASSTMHFLKARLPSYPGT